MKKIGLYCNWKSYISSVEIVEKILDMIKEKFYANVLSDIDLILFPQNVLIYPIMEYLSEIDSDCVSVGSQDVCIFPVGAYTGCTSAEILSSIGCKCTIVGHSERRSKFNETNEMIAIKTRNLLENNIVPVVCLGGQDSNMTEKAIIEDQIEKVLSDPEIDIEKANKNGMVFAYEPVSAIGTGINAPLDQVSEMCSHISEYVQTFGIKDKFSILYGGSVNSDNIIEYISLEDVHGVLVGGASVNDKKLSKMIEKINEEYK